MFPADGHDGESVASSSKTVYICNSASNYQTMLLGVAWSKRGTTTHINSLAKLREERNVGDDFTVMGMIQTLDTMISLIASTTYMPDEFHAILLILNLVLNDAINEIVCIN